MIAGYQVTFQPSKKLQCQDLRTNHFLFFEISMRSLDIMNEHVFFRTTPQMAQRERNLLPELQIKGGVGMDLSKTMKSWSSNYIHRSFIWNRNPLKRKILLGNPSFSGFQFYPSLQQPSTKAFRIHQGGNPQWCDGIPAACRASPLSPIAMHIVIHEGRLTTKAWRLIFLGAFWKK